MSVSRDRAITDLKAAFKYLSSIAEVDTSKIGVIGWCMGGSYSFIAAANLPRLDACVINYGRVDTSTLDIARINCPVLCNFAELDKSYTPEMGKAFVKAMKSNGRKAELHIYPGVNHAFMNPNNTSGYSELQAKLAWENIYKFLRKNL
jgi:carboxymethylenebutenolidase